MLLNCGVGGGAWDCKEIQPVHSKGDQSWVFIGRTDAEAETLVLWPPLAKTWLIGKDSDAGRDWGQEEKGMTEDEMAGWHHWLDGHEFEWTPGDGDGQGGLACCNSWGHRVGQDWAAELNWTELSAETQRSPSPLQVILNFWKQCPSNMINAVLCCKLYVYIFLLRVLIFLILYHCFSTCHPLSWTLLLLFFFLNSLSLYLWFAYLALPLTCHIHKYYLFFIVTFW